MSAAMAAWHEEPLLFGCAGESLVGVLAQPRSGAIQGGVVIVVGGPQYRAGSHRQFVLLARHLAGLGLAVLRFDVRGMGDSAAERVAHFESIDADIEAACVALRSRLPAGAGLALWGLCDGASAALLHVERRVSGTVQALCLANPWVRSAATQARTQVKHYYRDRLRQRAFWIKLLKGGVAGRALADLWRNLRLVAAGRNGTRPAGGDPASNTATLPFQARMAAAWRRFPGPVLLLLSGNDYTAREFADLAASDPAWRGLLERPEVTRVDLPGADHTFSDPEGRLAAEQTCGGWLLRVLAPAGPT